MHDFDFGLGEDIDLLRETVREFAATEVAPRAQAIDHLASATVVVETHNWTEAQALAAARANGPAATIDCGTYRDEALQVVASHLTTAQGDFRATRLRTTTSWPSAWKARARIVPT